MKPALVLSCHTTGLGVIRALGAAGIPVVALFYDDNDMGQVSRYCVERLRVPHPAQREEEFIAALVSLASRHGGGVLFPCDDETLCAVARHRPELVRHYAVTCPEWGVIRNVVQKQFTYDLARRVGIPHPRTQLVGARGSVDRTFVEEIGFPCLVKPCESHLYAKALHKKLAKVASFAALERECGRALDAGLQVMLQEFIPGPDEQNINYNSYAKDSRVLADFTAEKVRLCPPESGVPCVVRSRDIPEVRPLAARMLEGLGYSGYSCMEFKRDPRNGVFKLLEVNGRYNRSIALSLACAVNFPLIDYRQLVGGPRAACRTSRPGMYWIDLTKDPFSWLPYLRQGKMSLGRLIAPYLRRHVFSDLQMRDLKPFVKRIGNLAQRLFRGTRAGA